VWKNSIVHESNRVLLRNMSSVNVVKGTLVRVLLVGHVDLSFVSSVKNQEKSCQKKERNHWDISQNY
jgi:hypothetical protein